MYFVTMGCPGYVLFCTTPRGHAAIGLTDAGVIRLLAAVEDSRDWRTLREWPTSTYSHTDLMIRLAGVAEPDRAEDLLRYLPEETLG